MKSLLHRHRDLCERAVDPLEVAAGLEAAGITDRTAAHFRHRDVFSLAEEMYARAAHADDTDPVPAAGRAAPVPGAGTPGARLYARLAGARSVIVRTARAHIARLRALWAYAGWFVVALLPGTACVLLLAVVPLATGRTRLATGACGVLALTGALCLALRYGPLRSRRRTGLTARLATCVLLGYALLGDRLLRAALADGDPGALRALRAVLDAARAPGGDGTGTPWAPAAAHGRGVSGLWADGIADGAALLQPFAPATVLALAFAVVPAACCARLFSDGARRRVARSRGLAEFATAMRPLLCAVLALFLWILTALLTLAATVLHQDTGYAGPGALGALLLLARLLAVHGELRVPTLVLGAAGAVEVLTLAAVCAGRLPGCGRPAALVQAAVAAAGPGAVPGAACGAAFLVLLAYAIRTLTRASAHFPEGSYTKHRHQILPDQRSQLTDQGAAAP